MPPLKEPAPAGAGLAASPPRRVRIVEARTIATGTRLLAMAPVDPAPAPPVTAGAHIDLHLPGDRLRQYSLLPGPEGVAGFRIAVRLVTGGRGGSRWLHQEAQEGMTLLVGAPRNTFRPIGTDGPAVVIAGGSGIAPMLAIAAELRRLGRPFTLHYAAHSTAEMAFRAELALQPGTFLHCHDAGSPRLAVTRICQTAAADADLYCCGPPGMMAEFEAATRGRSPWRIHAEHFSAKTAPGTTAALVVDCARSGRQIGVRADQSIADALGAAGIDTNISCGEGLCGACETTVLEGIPDHRCQVLGPAERAAGRSMMICCSRAVSARLVLDL